jgi:hypothetical protein
MRTIATLAGLVALASVSAQAAPLPPAKATRVELGTAPSNWCAKDAGGVGTAHWRDRWGYWHWGRCVPNW